MRDSGDVGGWTTRRRLLAAMAGGSLSALAGCSSQGNDVTSSSQVFGRFFRGLPEQAQLNPWNASYPSSFASVIFEYLALRTPGEDPRPADLVESVDVDGTTVTVRFAEGYRWWNGRPVTARDRWVADRIEAFRNGGDAPEVTLVDDYTLRYELETPLARPLVFSKLLDGPLDTSAWLFERWVERFEDASTAAQTEAVSTDLQSYSIDLDEAAERGFGCGPYKFAEVSPNRMILERFEDHPRAEDVSVPRLWFPAAMGERTEELLGKGWIDGGGGLLSDRGVSIPDHIEQLARFPAVNGRKLVFDWRNVHLARREVRRALACALPLRTLVTSADWGRPASLQTGLTIPSQRRWLSASLRERLHVYPVEADAERAASFLREADYERRGGRWFGPDGRRMVLRLLVPIQAGATANLIERSIENFGIKLAVDQVSATSFLAVAEAKNYDLLLWWSEGRPYVAYDVTEATPWTLGHGVSDPSVETAPNRRPVAPTVPERPGDLTAESGRTVNLVDQWRRIQGPTSREETAEAVSLIARWWNFDLPDLDLSTAVAGVWGNTRDFEWPAPDDPALRTFGASGRPEYYLLKTGRIRPAGD